jgi:hypothetical protein
LLEAGDAALSHLPSPVCAFNTTRLILTGIVAVNVRFTPRSAARIAFGVFFAHDTPAMAISTPTAMRRHVTPLVVSIFAPIRSSLPLTSRAIV